MNTNDLNKIRRDYPRIQVALEQYLDAYPDKREIIETFLLGGAASVMARFCDFDDEEHDYTCEMVDNILSCLDKMAASR